MRMTDLAPLTIPLLFPLNLVGVGSFYLTLRDEYCMIRGDEPGKC